MELPIVDDLVAEQETLDDLMSSIDEAAWSTPSTAEGWTVADEIAHLAFSDEVAVSSLNGADSEEFARLRRTPRGRGSSVIRSPAEGRSGPDILTWWRQVRTTEVDSFRRIDPTARVLWGPNYMAAPSLCTARLMETWAHGLDCFMALGAEPTDSDRLRHSCHITYRAIPHAFRDGGRDMPGSLDELVVELTSPAGEMWRFGSEGAPQRIEGSAAEFARVGVRRRRLADATTLRGTGPLAVAALGTLKAYL
jgi:uncharacterized protein (TIGR03084 family)